MTQVWGLAALWLGLALIATLLSIWLRVSAALSEIVVGTIAQLVIGALVGASVLGTDESWVRFLSGTGAIVLTFLAGAELDPQVFKLKWREAGAVGLVSFFLPFLVCTAAAYYVLGWEPMPSWLAGVALSTTSVAVVYAVMLEFGFNTTNYGKTVLAACFITDLGTVLALGLIFAPFTFKTLVFVGVGVLVFVVLPWLTPRFFKIYGNRPSELEAKFLLLALFGMGALAAWADSEPVLPAYLIGMVLAGTVGKDHALIRRLRTLTFGLLTPFYFIRAGSFVSIPALIAAPGAFVFLLIVKVGSKFIGVYPAAKVFRAPHREAMYTTLLMSTGLTFGTISALFGLSHKIIDQAQYSTLVAGVIASAVIPTLIANAVYLPRHLAEARPRRRRTSGSNLGEEPCGVISGSNRHVQKDPHRQRRFSGRREGLGRSHCPRTEQAELHMICVEELPRLPDSIEEIAEEKQSAGHRFEKVIHDARARAKLQGIKLHTHVVAGHAVPSIVDFIERDGYDLLVIGFMGHSALYNRLIGSTTDRLVELAPCPVLVVK